MWKLVGQFGLGAVELMRTQGPDATISCVLLAWARNVLLEHAP